MTDSPADLLAASDLPRPVPRLVPILSSAGPYRVRFPWLTGSCHTIATDASCAAVAPGPPSVAAWAAVRGDGRAVFGWYHADQTNSTLAELEAIRWGLKRLTINRERTHVMTDSNNASRIIYCIRDGKPVIKDTTILHPGQLEELADKLHWRPVEFHVWEKAPPGRNKNSHPGLLGLADRLAWSALQVALYGLAVDDPAVQRWLASETFRSTTRRDRLRVVWRRRGFPGHVLP